MIYLISILVVMGAIFVFLAALGIYRFPDLYTRCHASSKASTVGKIFPFLAVALFFWDLESSVKSTLVILFFFFTVPVGTHLITRAGYIRGAKMAKNTVLDEYKGNA